MTPAPINNNTPATQSQNGDHAVTVNNSQQAPFSPVGKASESQMLSRVSYRVTVSQSMIPVGDRNPSVSRINFDIEKNDPTNQSTHSDDDVKSVDIDLDPKKPVVEVIPVHERKDFIWLIIFGSLLTFTSGCLNAISSAQVGYTATIASGATTKLATNIYAGNGSKVRDYALMLGPFVFGAFISGAGAGNGKFVMGNRYGIFLVIIGILFIIGTVVVREATGYIGLAIWAGAAGMQNAMITSYSGGVFRTTHITGMLTDLGNAIGHYINHHITGEPAGNTWKLMVLVPQFICFFLGGLIGQGINDGVGVDGVFMIGGLLLFLGTAYIIAGACGVFDGFLAEEVIEKEMEIVEKQFHEALHKAYHHSETAHSHTDGHGGLSRQPSHHSMPAIQAHLHPVRASDSQNVSAHQSKHLDRE